MRILTYFQKLGCSTSLKFGRRVKQKQLLPTSPQHEPCATVQEYVAHVSDTEIVSALTCLVSLCSKMDKFYSQDQARLGSG